MPGVNATVVVPARDEAYRIGACPAHLGTPARMNTDEKTDPDEQFEKVTKGISPSAKTSYAPAETSDDDTERAEKVRREIREDRRRS